MKKMVCFLSIVFILLGFSVASAFPPAPRPPASTTVAGIVMYCSDGIASLATSTTCAVTPSNLPSIFSSPSPIGDNTPNTGAFTTLTGTTVAGGMISSDAETVAGTATDHLLTPANVAAVYQYQTIYVPASSMLSTTTNGAPYAQNEYATNDINIGYLAFDGTTEEYTEIEFPFPENWDRGTVKAKFFWSSASGSTTGDTVEWEIACGAQSDNAIIDAALGTSQVISDTLLDDNGTKRQLSGATPVLTVGGTPALGDMIHCKVSRNVGGTDDMSEDAWLFGVWIQYKVGNTVATW